MVADAEDGGAGWCGELLSSSLHRGPPVDAERNYLVVGGDVPNTRGSIRSPPGLPLCCGPSCRPLQSFCGPQCQEQPRTGKKSRP
jgi:hypothetical protein